MCSNGRDLVDFKFDVVDASNQIKTGLEAHI